MPDTNCLFCGQHRHARAAQPLHVSAAYLLFNCNTSSTPAGFSFYTFRGSMLELASSMTSSSCEDNVVVLLWSKQILHGFTVST